MLHIPQRLSVTACLETHRTCFIFELAWCWGFSSCNIYHHAEVFGLHETANAERASAGSADISASVTQAWQTTAQSQRCRGVWAAAAPRHVCSGPRGWNPVLSSDTHTPLGMWLSQGPSFPSVRRERNGTHYFVQCSSPTGMENTTSNRSQSASLLGSPVPGATVVQQHGSCQDHCEHFTCKLVAI